MVGVFLLCSEVGRVCIHSMEVLVAYKSLGLMLEGRIQNTRGGELCFKIFPNYLATTK